MTKRQTPLTVEIFQEFLMPQIDKKFADLKEEIQVQISNLPTKEDVNHLPTKNEYYEREDKTMGELQKLREEVSITGHHYEKTNKRIDIIDKNLGIDTSSVF